MGGTSLNQEELSSLRSDCADAGIVFRVKRGDGDKVFWKKPDLLAGYPPPPPDLLRRVDACKSGLARFVLGITSAFDGDVDGDVGTKNHTPPIRFFPGSKK